MNETTDGKIDDNGSKISNLSMIDQEYCGLDSGEDFSKYLLDRMKQLESRNTYLKEQRDQIESEKRYAENQKLKYEREVRKLQAELDRLKTAPLVIGTVLNVVDDDRVLIRSSTGPQFIVSMSHYLDEDSLVPGAKVALNQHTLAVMDVIPSAEGPEVCSMEVVEPHDVDYDLIGGLDEQIRELQESVELPLVKPEAFSRIGISPPKGVLLYGPPGTGKTLLAKAVANRTDATFIRVVGSELVKKYIGEGSKLVREIFDMARKKAPSIIFIDELDAIAARRVDDGNGADREVQRTLMQLLAEMDGFDVRGDVRIVAATNRPDVLDPAIMRPGRFDRVVSVPLPDRDARESILRIHTRDMKMSNDVDFKRIASLAEGSSGADLNAIVMEAGMLAVRNDRESISMEDLLSATNKVLKSLENPMNTYSGLMFV